MGGMISSGLQLASLFTGQQQSNTAAQAQAQADQVAAQNRYLSQQQQQADQVAAQNRYLSQQQAVQDKQQRDLMQRQLAAARARLSANGVGVGAGSGQALLAGIVKNSENDIADSQALLQTRQANSSIGLNSGYGQSSIYGQSLDNRPSSGEGLIQGLTRVQTGWNLLKDFLD